MLARIVTGLLLLLSVYVARGTVVLHVEFDDAVPQNTPTSVTVSATSDSSDLVSTLTFPVDIGNDGDAIPAGFAFGMPEISSTLFSLDSFNTDQNDFFDVDGIINMSSIAPSITLSATPTVLFEINVFVSAPPGTPRQPIHIVNPTTPFNTFKLEGPMGMTPTVGTIMQGSAAVVPEPTSFLFLGLLAVASSALSRFRKRRAR